MLNKKRIMAICFFFMAAQVIGQSSKLYFGTGVMDHPNNFLSQGENSLLIPDYENLPLFKGNIGWRKNIRQSNWLLDLSIFYMHSQSVYENTLTINYYDPALGLEPGDELHTQTTQLLNFTGLEAGIAYDLRLGRGMDRLLLPFGIKTIIPVLCKQVYTANNYRNETGIYRGEYFKDGIFYGLYFKPTYQFKFSKSYRNLWSFGIFGEADLLILNQSQSNPKFIYGGGLEVCYSLR